jgi:nucleoside-diphosphate-sugar epimerase
MNKVAIVTGVTGQDGSYLSELLLDKGYTVVGLRRRSSSEKGLERINHVLNNDNFKLVEADITDPANVCWLLQTYLPDEVYNLAAQSHVKRFSSAKTGYFLEKRNRRKLLLHKDLGQRPPAPIALSRWYIRVYVDSGLNK